MGIEFITPLSFGCLAGLSGISSIAGFTKTAGEQKNNLYQIFLLFLHLLYRT